MALLGVFIPTFFFVSITPGMSMAMGPGMSIGYRRTLWMIIGEMIGIGLVAVAAVLGIASVMLNYPWLFTILKSVGAAYLFYLGIKMWQSTGKFALSDGNNQIQVGHNWDLVMQGFVTTIANPKGWAFMFSLLPPFIESSKPLAPQLTLLVAIILAFEFICMPIYAIGRK